MKNLFKITSLIVSVLILLSVCMINPSPVKAIKSFTVEVMNPELGAESGYKFHFTIEKTVEIHDYIKMLLPAGSIFEKIPIDTPIDPPRPPSPCPSYYPEVEYQEDNSILIKFISHIRLDPSIAGYRDIDITIPKSPNIQDADGNWFTIKFFNPKNPGKYIYKIATKPEPEYVESIPVEFVKQSELPDNINSNLWFSNNFKGQTTRMIIHIPIQVNEMNFFEFKILFPDDIIDLKTFFGKNNINNNLEFVKEYVYLNNIPLKDSATKNSIIELIDDDKCLHAKITPINKALKSINIFFDNYLQIKFTKEEILEITDSNITIERTIAGDIDRKDINLQFQDNYIFP